MKALVNLKSRLLAAFALLLFSWWSTAKTDVSGEWPQWRGPRRDGISNETGLLKQWPPEGPPQVWKINGLGNVSPTVSTPKARIFTMGLKENREFVIALYAAAGKPLWAQASGGRF